jgi:hypothetical protein
VRFDAAGELDLDLSFMDNLDIGNYRRTNAGMYVELLLAGREHGDDEVADAALRGLDRLHGRLHSDGSLRYSGLSNFNNAHVVMGRMMRRHDWRNLVLGGPPAEALRGPVLAETRFPDVQVARARSDAIGAAPAARALQRDGRDQDPAHRRRSWHRDSAGCARWAYLPLSRTGALKSVACCILAAFIMGHCVMAWRWLQMRWGQASRPNAACWVGGQSTPVQAPKLRRTVLPWILGIGLATAAIGMTVHHGDAPIAWCRGTTHE